MVKGYNSKDVVLVVNGRYMTGMADGSFVEWEKDDDSFEVSNGAQGDVGVSENNSESGTITLTLMQTSPDVAYLNGLANARTYFPVYAKHSGDPAESAGGTMARILKPAAAAFSNEIESREFEIKVFDFKQE